MRQRLLRAFSLWYRKISEQRCCEGLQRRIAAQEQQLQETETVKRQQRARDEALEKAFSVEREKAFVAVSRQHALKRELDALKAQVVEYTATTEDGARREKELVAALRSEKEKAFVAAARYNALVSKTEKEQVLWMEKLHMSEEILAKHATGESGDRSAAVTYSDSSVMTSLEQLPKPTVPTPRKHTEAATSGASRFAVSRSKTGMEIETTSQMASAGSALFVEEVASQRTFGEDEETNAAAFRQILHSSGNRWWLQEDLDESQLMLAMEERVQQKLPQRKKTQTVKKSALPYDFKLINISVYASV